MSVGERIAVLRKEQNISQGKLAESLGISRQAVSKWETDQSSPDTLNLIRLADALNTEVEYLATGRKAELEQPPIIVKVVKKVDKIVEKVVEKPVIQRKVRIVYRRNGAEYAAVGIFCFLIGLALGILI